MPEQELAVRVSIGDGAYRWLSEEARKHSLVLMDIGADATEDELRLDLDVVFNAIPIRRRGMKGRADFYAGTPGGRIEVDLTAGKLGAATGSVAVTTGYTNTVERTQNTTVRVGLRGIKDDASSATVEKGTTYKQTCAFEGSERILQPIRVPPHAIRWDLRSTRGQKAVSDFASGNLPLWLNIAWERGSIEGKASVVPDRLAFYGPDRSPLGFAKSLLMQATLMAEGIRIRNADGLSIGFEARS